MPGHSIITATAYVDHNNECMLYCPFQMWTFKIFEVYLKIFSTGKGCVLNIKYWSKDITCRYSIARSKILPQKQETFNSMHVLYFVNSEKMFINIFGKVIISTQMKWYKTALFSIIVCSITYALQLSVWSLPGDKPNNSLLIIARPVPYRLVNLIPVMYGHYFQCFQWKMWDVPLRILTLVVQIKICLNKHWGFLIF